MNRLLLFCVAFLLLFAKAKGDHLIIDGRSVYFDGISPLEQYHDIKNLTKKLIGFDGLSCYDCGCIKFDAEWEIINETLYLTNIYSCSGNPALKADLKTLFEQNIINGKVPANWFTGDLWIPAGKSLSALGATVFYNAESRITIVKGKIIATKDFSYPHAQELIYINQYSNDALAKFIYSHINWEKLPPLNGQVKKFLLSFETGISGSPENVKLIRESAENTAFKEEAKRVIGSIPLGAYYKHGQIFKQTYTMPFTFSEELRKKYSQ